jgi:hypothetical protein
MIKKPLTGATSVACALLLGALMQGDAAIAKDVGAGKDCRDNADERVDHDTCVVASNAAGDATGEGDFAAFFCKLMQDLPEIFGIIPYGQCMRTLAQY